MDGQVVADSLAGAFCPALSALQALSHVRSLQHSLVKFLILSDYLTDMGIEHTESKEMYSNSCN